MQNSVGAAYTFISVSWKFDKTSDIRKDTNMEFLVNFTNILKNMFFCHFYIFLEINSAHQKMVRKNIQSDFKIKHRINLK